MKNDTAVADSAMTEAPKVIFKIEPFGEWVLIRKVERGEARSEAGVILPGGGRSSRGEVLAFGELVPKQLPNIAVGQIVIFTNYPIALEDIEELTSDKSLKLVRAEECYARANPCT